VKAPWAWTAQKARFFTLDARVTLPLALWLLRWGWLTLGLALISLVGLALLERRGLSLGVAWPLARTRLLGPIREVSSLSRLRRRCRW
jgi:hypothetical protein